MRVIHRRVAVPAVMATAALVLAACGDDKEPVAAGGETQAPAEDWEPAYVDGVLQPLPDGYPEEKITIVVPDDATSSEGVLSLHVQQIAEKYAPVPVDLEIRADFESFPTWEALAAINESEEGRNGYIINPFGTVGSLADTMAADVEGATGVNVDDLRVIAGLEKTRWFMAQCAEVDWDPTVEDLVDYIKENPGEVRYMGQGAGGGVDLGFFSTMKALGVTADELNAIPIGGVSEQATATAACEGDVTNTGIEPQLPHVQAGRLELLMVNGEGRVEEYPDVPTAEEVGVENPIQSGRQMVTSTEVSPERVAWLAELLRAVSEDEEYIALREAIPGVEVIYEDTETAEANNEVILEVTDGVLRDLGLRVES